jgi:HEAT repeats
MRCRFLATVLLAICVTAKPALAVPVPMVDVPDMAQASDLIVVGRASQTQNNLAPFVVAVDRVIKGGAAGSWLVVALDPRGYGSVQEGQYGIFFLRRQTSGSYVVTDPFHPALVASPLRAPNQQSPVDVLGGLAAELAGVLTAPAATLTDPVNGVQGLVVGSPAAQAQYVYYGAAVALETIPYVESGPAVDAIATSNQTSARLWALYSLFSMVDWDDETAKANALSSVQPILVNPEPELAFAVSMLANAIEGHLKSPQAVPALAALLGSTQVAVRRAAASVLGDIATTDVVAPLANVALNDGDDRVRFLAVRGLALTTGAGPAPTIAAFRQQRGEILQFWSARAHANVRGP